MSSADVFSWLSRFINLESGQTPKSFRLDRMEVLAELAGNPQRCAPAIHIAGSKGKGSVTAMIASMLDSAGYRVARYMSPHVSDYRERIGVGNSFFSEEVYCAAGDELRELAEQAVPKAGNKLFDADVEDGEGPSFFELLTLYFFLCARRGNCNAMVVETGMGGRLDSTNVLDPLVSVITLIELEHTKFLGSTIEAVAGEKAGIIKTGRPLVLAKQSAAALEVFRKRAQEKQSRLLYFPEIATISNINIHKGGTSLALHYRSGGEAGCPLFSAPLELSVPIPGVIQAENAGLAVTALKTAFPHTGEDAIRRGLERVHIPARFETISQNPLLVIDGAHTPESAALCAETFCSLHGEGGILLFGCAADKNAVGMAQVLLPRFSRVFITTPGTFKSSDLERVYEAFCSVPGAGGKVTLVADTALAVQQAAELAARHNLPVLGTGSFYLAAEIRAVVTG